MATRTKEVSCQRAIQYILQLQQQQSSVNEQWSKDKIMTEQLLADITKQNEILKDDNQALRKRIADDAQQSTKRLRHRGVRQGCPLSGLLFNLFINDILDGVAPITVPGLPRDTNPIRGLMYADDVAVFADSEQSLLAASTAVEQWANWWEMQFGVAKCGIISFTGHLAPRLDNPLDIRLHGQLVSRVESYKYLGVLIDSKLDHSAWLKQKTVCTRAHYLGSSPSAG
ncbi:hypothetical protein BASA81_004531 [Batrachochytrium salamandrivorans]|nr:hypothetical protein BASA81_004531 [Batrachochytrium salamandrivorans]